MIRSARQFLFVCLLSLSAIAQQATPATGVIHTPDVDLAFEVYGKPSSETPVIAVNGGPGLSHKYMIQNDVWERLAERRQIVFYDQRGTGKSTYIQPGASQAMNAQVADLEAVRLHFRFEKIDV